MKTTIFAVGSRGDVQPYLALAVKLSGAGMDVTFAANEDYEALASEHHIRFAPIGVNAYEYSRSKAVRRWLTSKSPLELIVNTTRAVRPVLPRIISDTHRICRDSDFVIYHSFTLPYIFYFAEQLGIEAVPASLYPLRTKAHPALPVRLGRLSNPALNLFSHKMVETFSWGVFAQPFKKYWRSLGHTVRGNPHQRILSESKLVLCAYSPSLLPAPEDLPSNAVITGYWFLDSAGDWQPENGLADFLSAGDPPVFIGFGSMGSEEKDAELTQYVLKLVERTGLRVVIGSGWGNLGGRSDLPKQVYRIGSVPFDWLFPRMKAVVHHGGAGTTAIALAAGVPAFIVPHFSDNYFWGAQVAKLGVGPEPVPLEKLTEKAFIDGVMRAVEDGNMREESRALGSQIRTERGGETAISKIRERFLIS